jgi:hypothetical protein
MVLSLCDSVLLFVGFLAAGAFWVLFVELV